MADVTEVLNSVNQATVDDLNRELKVLETNRIQVVNQSRINLAQIDERIRLVKKLLALKGEGRMPRRKKEKPVAKEKQE